MDKKEFLDILRAALTGEIPPFEVEKHMSYYEEYLSDGADEKTEEEKLCEIGDPRLIARTIINTWEIKKENGGNRNYDKMSDKDEENQTENGAFNNSHMNFFSWDSMTWYQKLLLGLIGFLLIVVIIGLIWLGLNIFISLILPILIVIIVLRFAINLWRK